MTVVLDACKCWNDDCGWTGKVSQCGSEVEQETWEMPTYLVHICPECGEVIEDYFPLEELK